MILEAMVGIVVILGIANIIVRLDKDYEKQKEKWKVVEPEVETQKINEVKEKNVFSEEDYLNIGQIMANSQKLNLLNKRIYNLEKVVAEVGEKIQPQIETNEEKDFEKIDFRLKVLEQQIDEIKNPITKKDTFFGKENDKMETTIKSLAFNSKK
jgi:hypothetical protein